MKKNEKIKVIYSILFIYYFHLQLTNDDGWLALL